MLDAEENQRWPGCVPELPRVLLAVAPKADAAGGLGRGMLPPTDARAFALEHPVATLSNLLAAFAIYGLAGGGLAVRRYFTEGRRLAELAQERSLAELRAHQREIDTRLGLLQAQVEPHFLFNTLASVRSLIHTDPDLAQSTIDAYRRIGGLSARDDSSAPR